MTDQVCINSKFNIGEVVYVYNLFAPLIAEFPINGVIKDKDEFYYSTDNKSWIKAQYLYETKFVAYEALLKQVQDEMLSIAK